MTKNSDIRVPEGYFEDLQDRLLARRGETLQRPPVQRLAPYLAYAAMLSFAVVIGTAILRKTAAPAEEDLVYGAYMNYLAMSMDPDGAVYSFEDYELTREDLVDFLIDEGVSTQQIEFVNHEEDY